MKGIVKSIVIIFILVCNPLVMSANAANDNKDFDIVDFVFDHVNDSYEWHFFTIGNTHYSIPLPVILYSKQSGLHFFMSNKLLHHHSNSNFYLAKGGDYDGKIVEKLSDGSISVPIDFSMTKSVINTIILSVLLLFVSIKTAQKAKANRNSIPKGTHSVLEMIIVFVRDNIAKDYIKNNPMRYMPFLTSLFVFILTANLAGLILPLGINITANIAITLVLAVFTLITVFIHSNKHYWKHILNPDVPVFMKSPVAPIMQIIELMGVFIKPVVLMIRLFANMLAGHMIVTVLLGLVFLMAQNFGNIVGSTSLFLAIIFSIFIVVLDLLVAFIQTYIFTLLSALYIGSASENEH